MVAYKDGTRVQLVSRKDHSRRFADLAAAIRALPPFTLILGGEVAIFDDKLISRFEWCRKRPEEAVSTPPIYMAFDYLYPEGQELRQERDDGLAVLRRQPAIEDRLGLCQRAILFDVVAHGRPVAVLPRLRPARVHGVREATIRVLSTDYLSARSLAWE